LQNFIVEVILQRLPYYSWTGFYMLDPDDPETLVLGPFRGAPNGHGAPQQAAQPAFSTGLGEVQLTIANLTFSGILCPLATT